MTILIIFGIIYLIKHKIALTEVVKSFEATKYSVWNDDVKKDVDNIQSNSTKQLVSDVKYSESI